jgi:hypothetical protein
MTVAPGRAYSMIFNYALSQREEPLLASFTGKFALASLTQELIWKGGRPSQ